MYNLKKKIIFKRDKLFVIKYMESRLYGSSAVVIEQFGQTARKSLHSSIKKNL